MIESKRSPWEEATNSPCIIAFHFLFRLYLDFFLCLSSIFINVWWKIWETRADIFQSYLVLMILREHWTLEHYLFYGTFLLINKEKRFLFCSSHRIYFILFFFSDKQDTSGTDRWIQHHTSYTYRSYRDG